MPMPFSPPVRHALLRSALWASALCAAPVTFAQTLCNSDGQAAPPAVHERFLDADCSACWSAPDAPARQGSAHAVVLDWIVPSATVADQAAMAAAALPEAQARLDALHRPPPSAQQALDVRTPAGPARRGALRVARGAVVADYVGVSIAWKAPRATTTGPVTAWLLLAETVPTGTAGSPVERLLVRGVLTLSWQPAAGAHLAESRAMRVPDSADPARLRMVGWVEDARGRILAAAASHCRAS